MLIHLRCILLLQQALAQLLPQLLAAINRQTFFMGRLTGGAAISGKAAQDIAPAIMPSRRSDAGLRSKKILFMKIPFH